jgi:ribonuclease HI
MVSMSKKPKYYVVWRGRQPGIYTTWLECFAQINGFSGASHKAFDTLELAEEAFRSQRDTFRARHPDLFEPKEAGPRQPRLPIAGRPRADSYAVDAACSGAPGPVEYRCVQVSTGQEVFRRGPFENGTNNIGEFLALVHALALFKQRSITAPIYSDSKIALGWVHRKTCRTRLGQDNGSAALFELIRRAETWLRENEYLNELLKWETDAWGENPADFGRK